MNDIAELMDRDPLKLSRDDLTAIVAEFRKSRAQFNAGNIKAGSTKPKTEKQKAAAELETKLGGLELDL